MQINIQILLANISSYKHVCALVYSQYNAPMLYENLLVFSIYIFFCYDIKEIYASKRLT